jgi:broad specificity phosphatase PhoE
MAYPWLPSSLAVPPHGASSGIELVIAPDTDLGEAPDRVQAWLTDPTAEPPGGESLISLIERVGTWLDAAASRPPRVLAITHPAVVRSAIVHTLRAPADSFWRIDIAPLAVVEVRGQPGRWSLVP